MITALYLTYILFAGVALISTSVLLFKLNFALATLIVGFSILAYVVRVWGNIVILRKRDEVLAAYQAEQAQKQQEEMFSNSPVNTKGMN